jgi:YD repeat-containing protein
MTQRSVNGSPTPYTVNDRNQVTAIGASETAVFDANGNLISRFNSAGPNGLTYVYDDENRLVARLAPVSRFLPKETALLEASVVPSLAGFGPAR